MTSIRTRITVAFVMVKSLKQYEEVTTEIEIIQQKENDAIIRVGLPRSWLVI